MTKCSLFGILMLGFGVSAFAQYEGLKVLLMPPIQTEHPPTGKRLYVENYDQLKTEERQSVDCFIFKMKEKGPFALATSRDQADLALLFAFSMPGGAGRVLVGKVPSVRLSVSSVDGKALWAAENKFRKSTTIWGASADVPCGIANGIANKFAEALAKGKL